MELEYSEMLSPALAEETKSAYGAVLSEIRDATANLARQAELLVRRNEDLEKENRHLRDRVKRLEPRARRFDDFKRLFDGEWGNE